MSAYWRSGTWHIDWCVKAWTHGPLPLSSIMEESILSIDQSASPSDAGSLMQEYNISHLAVMEKDEVAGILSIKDLVYKK